MFKQISLLFVIATVSVNSAWADTIRVPQDQPNIRAAINAASDGDEIVVDDGTWSGPDNTSLDFGSKTLTVKSKNGPDNCIIDCEGSATAFYFNSGGGDQPRVAGLTIANGQGTHGGGIKISAGNPVIEGCKFVNCNASATGGGIFSQNASPMIIRSTFEDCTAGSFGGGAYILNGEAVVTHCTFTGCSAIEIDGGGLYLLGGSPFVDNSTFTGNTAFNAGGGVVCNNADVVIVDCQFNSNEAGVGGGLYNNGGTTAVESCGFTGNFSGSYGGGMTNDGAATSVENCDFTGNTSGQGGGACASSSGSFASLTDCNFQNNTSNNGGAVFNLNNHAPIAGCTFEGNHATANGGAIYNSGSNPPIVGSTIVGNTATFTGGGIRNINSDCSLRNAIVFSNAPTQIHDSSGSTTAARYCNISGGWSGPGNINVPPMLTSPSTGDFRPLPGSPCIDAADNTAFLPGTLFDINGDPRFVDDPKTADSGIPGGDGGSNIGDIGAAEFQLSCGADLNGDGNVDTLDFLLYLTAWANSDPIADWNQDGTVNTLDFLAFLGDWVSGC
jgi:hypothetical protein